VSVAVATTLALQGAVVLWLPSLDVILLLAFVGIQ